MKFAYADPPYLSCSWKHYSTHHPEASDFDDIVTHINLIQRLRDEYPDGWALSMASTNLYDLLPHCPDEVRIGAWVKPFASFKPNVNPAYAWEPVVFCGGRKRSRNEPTARDWCSVPITMQRGLAGAKPEAFCFWIFDLLGVRPTDDFVDLFPGSGAVTAAWERYRARATGFDGEQTVMEVA